MRDIKVLNQVRELLRDEANPIVGYTGNGNPISRREFVKQIEVAEKEYESGKYQTIEEVEKESENW